MRAVSAVELEDNFKNVCDMVLNGETIIVSRPYNENVVMLSEKEYKEILKGKQNAEYMAMIDQAMQEIEEGRTIVKTLAELEAMTNG